MTATHDSLVSVVTNLSVAPQAGVSFGNVLLLAEDISFGGGALAKEYTSAQSVIDDGPNGAAILSADIVDAGITAFSQLRAPSTFLVGTVDVAGAEAYDTALQNIRAAGFSFYAVCTESRASADHLLVAADVQTQRAAGNQEIFIAQIADADAYGTSTEWSDPSTGSAYKDVLEQEGNFFVFNDDQAGADWHDIAAAVARLNYDLETTSPNFRGRLQNISAPFASGGAAALTQAQVNAIKSNDVNVVAPYGPTNFYLANGVNVLGRPMKHIVSVDWFVSEFTRKLKAAVLEKDDAGETVPVDVRGQIWLQNKLDEQIGIGIAAGHFASEDQIVYTFPDITATDLTEERIRVTVDFQLSSGARQFDFTFNFTEQEVA